MGEICSFSDHRAALRRRVARAGARRMERMLFARRFRIDAPGKPILHLVSEPRPIGPGPMFHSPWRAPGEVAGPANDDGTA